MKQKLLNLKSLLLLLLMTVSMGARADEIPTFGSLEKLIESGEKYGSINVSINNVINYAWNYGDYYRVSLKSNDDEVIVLAPSPKSDLNWMPGGTLNATLTNVSWYGDGTLTLQCDTEDFWENFTYTAPEVTVYKSIADLLADENIPQGYTTVSVKINDQISDIQDNGPGACNVYLDNNKIFIAGYSNPDRSWEVGGTVIGLLENVIYVTSMTDEKGTPMLVFPAPDRDIFEGLTYTDLPTFKSLENLIATGQSYDAVNVTIEDVVLGAMENEGKYMVMLQNNEVILMAPAQESELNWLSGGTVTGTLTNVHWDNSDRLLIGDNKGLWNNLTYTAPEIKEYESIEALLDANIQGSATVTVKIHNIISNIDVDEDGMYLVSLETENGNSTLLSGYLDSAPDWKAGGTLTGTLTNVTAYNVPSSPLQLVSYTGNIFKDLTYTAPIPTFGSLDELEAANLPNGTHVNVYIEGTVQSSLIMGSEYSIYFTDKLREFCCLTTDIQYEPEWYQPDGMLTGTLKNVVCVRSGNSFSFKSPNASHNIFEGLEFTPNYKSLNDLYAAIGGIEIGSWVPVRLNGNEIVKITDDAVCVKDGDNVFALKANVPCGSDWKVGGTLENTWLAKYNGWDEELQAYSLQYAAKNSNPWSDLYYVFTETYASLEELIKSGQKSGPINVTINNVILGTWDNEGMWYVYVQSGNEEICLKAPLPDSKPDWLPGGTLEAALTNVSWSNPYLRGTNKEFWDNFTYTPPVVTEYESIADLLAADIQGVAVVTVKNINNQISKIEKQGNYYDVYLDDNNIFLAGDNDPDRDWEAGGTLNGKLENVIYTIDEDGTPALYMDKGDILTGLTYTAPLRTFGSLDELEAANLPNGTHVNVYVEGTVESALTDLTTSKFTIFFTDKSKQFSLKTDLQHQAAWYEPDGMLTGTLKDVVYNKGDRYEFISPNKEHNIFEGLEFTPNYKSLNDLYAAIDGIKVGSWVPVALNGNEIVEIKDNAVLVKDGDNIFALTADVSCPSNWKVEGSLKNTWLAKYQGWDEELKAYTLQYAAKNSNPWSDLRYTFVETYASLEELIESGQEYGPINVTINNVILDAWDNGERWYVDVLSGDEQIDLRAPIPDSKPDWLPGGTIRGELTNVFWSFGGLEGETKEFWDNFTYTPPVVTEYESIEALLADENIQQSSRSTTVSVKINNQISEIEDWDGYYYVYLDNDKIFIVGDSDPDRKWEEGGTLTGTLTNVVYTTAMEIPMLHNPYGNIFESLKYTPPAVGTISISSVGYTTYFTDKEFVMPEGLEGYVVTPKDETSVTLTKAFDGGEIVPASTALLVKGAAGSYPCAGSNTGTTFTGDNCLHGNLAAGTVAAVEGASKYYKLLNGSNGLGWYLGAPDGGVFSLGANKAYLALSEAQAQNAKSLSLVFDDATAIENVNADAENARAFNLAGQRVKANHKGIVIVNGKKIVNKSLVSLKKC